MTASAASATRPLDTSLTLAACIAGAKRKFHSEHTTKLNPNLPTPRSRPGSIYCVDPNRNTLFTANDIARDG